MVWYLLVVISGTQPQITTYPTEQEACASFASNPGAHVYSVTEHRDKPVIVEGECKAVQSFVSHK